MSNASLKEQLQALASKLSHSGIVSNNKLNNDNRSAKEKLVREPKLKQKFVQTEKPKKVKPKWLEYVQYGVELLKTYFPESFKPFNQVKPLKKGIKQDLIKRLSTLTAVVTEDKACMVKSLAYYVNTAAYHKSVVEGATRIDLDGQPTGVVTAEEAKYSIERQQAKLQARKANPSPATSDKTNISA